MQEPRVVGPHDDGRCLVNAELSLRTPWGWGHMWEWGVTANSMGLLLG